MDEANCLSVTLRDFSMTDQAFVYATWRNSLYYGSDMKKDKNAKSIFKDLTHSIKETLKKATVKVACLDETPDVIVGYVVYTKTRLDWVYVKDDFRRQGVATLMVPKNIKSYSQSRTKVGDSILKSKENENGSVKED